MKWPSQRRRWGEDDDAEVQNDGRVGEEGSSGESSRDGDGGSRGEKPTAKAKKKKKPLSADGVVRWKYF